MQDGTGANHRAAKAFRAVVAWGRMEAKHGLQRSTGQAINHEVF